MSWIEGPMLGFDTETTGVDTTTDRIVTAALIYRGAPDSRNRDWLINPGIEIPERATAVHGISTAHAREQGREPGGALAELAEALASHLAQGFPVVGFNVAYDLNILEAELARHGVDTLSERLGGNDSIRPIVDPLVLDRHVDRYRKGKRKLIDLCAHYRVDVDSESLHSADADVGATLDLIVAMAAAFPTIASVDLVALHDQQVAAHRAWAENFRAWLTSKGRTDDLPEVNWPVAA